MMTDDHETPDETAARIMADLLIPSVPASLWWPAPDLLSVAHSNLKILKALHDVPTESGVFNVMEYQLLEQAIADTEAAIAAA